MELTIQERLKDLRVERGLTLEQLAEQTGLSKSALGSYEADDFKDISHYALIKLAKFYGVTADYLLGLSETKNHANADLADLHLRDELIELLKSGRINTVLLCEMAAHPDFVKLLADMDKYQPGEHDKTMYLLKAAHVQEGEYFSRRVHDDIDGILEDIKAAHRGRSESAPETSVIAELKRDLDEAANFKGSRLEQLIFLFCKQTKLRYNKLTEEEKGWLVRIAQKPELLKTAVPQRGKRGR